jgi:uncharacterized UBP type Zn finger protein
VDTYGVFGWAFADFGQNFEVFDKNGEEPKEVFLSHITQEKEAVVTTLENHIHSFEEGDIIKLTEIEGMPELNYIEGVNPVTFKVLKGKNMPFHGKEQQQQPLKKERKKVVLPDVQLISQSSLIFCVIS